VAGKHHDSDDGARITCDWVGKGGKVCGKGFRYRSELKRHREREGHFPRKDSSEKKSDKKSSDKKGKKQ
jgi:hypothetical protein